VFRGLTIDMDQTPLNDIHVRRALYYATDREGIASGLFPGQAVAASTLNTPDLFSGVLPEADVTDGYDKIATFPYDLAKAKEELAQSSVPDGFDLTINAPDGSNPAVLITQAIKESWSQIGVNVELNLMPGGPRFQIILDHGPDLEVQIMGNVPDVPDPMQLLALYYDSAAAAKNGNNSSDLKFAVRKDWTSEPMNGFSLSNNFVSVLNPG
jgi:peptide/nickel transport system substrate-binding protein